MNSRRIFLKKKLMDYFQNSFIVTIIISMKRVRKDVHPFPLWIGA